MQIMQNNNKENEELFEILCDIALFFVFWLPGQNHLKIGTVIGLGEINVVHIMIKYPVKLIIK